MPRPKEPRKQFPDVERRKILNSSTLSLWSQEGVEALKYLREKRHLSDSIIKEFQFGWCPKYINHELSGRITMPIFDSYGELIAFSSRDFDAPKQYQHWHESFDKSEYIYGLHLSKQEIIKQNYVIIVEGQFDVTCLHSYGLRNTVGICGGILSIVQLMQLMRYCSRFVLLFDPDKAGEHCNLKAIELFKQWKLYKGGSEKNGMDMIVVNLPKDKDPDDFVIENSKEALLELIKEKFDAQKSFTY